MGVTLARIATGGGVFMGMIVAGVMGLEVFGRHTRKTMSDILPELNRKASEAAESASNRARNLIPWLPTPHTCPECSVLCEADVVFDQRMVEPTESWYCESCDTHYYREEPWHE